MNELLKTCPWVLTDGMLQSGGLCLAVSCRDGSRFISRGSINGDPLRRVLPIIRTIISRVQDDRCVPLDLHTLIKERPDHKGGRDLPLDNEAGYKLALIFKLAERVKEMGRVELIARRVERFTREEAGYWLSRLYDYGPDASRFALKGLRVLLGGEPKDEGVQRMLEQVKRFSI